MHLLNPHVKDLGGFTVRRVLPGPPLAGAPRFVGPFVFFDHMGPATFGPDDAVDVRPHPHIGLATVTYLFEGAMVHRDSLGTRQRIEPGDVNWMVAGHGIVHSERTAPEDRGVGMTMHGLQTWVALPRAHEQTAPSFSHIPKSALPTLTVPGARLRVLAGDYLGERAPTPVLSPTLYVAIEADAGARLTVDPSHEERAVYLVQGEASVDGQRLPEGHMVVLDAGVAATVASTRASILVLVGGATLDGERHLWWNFVASDRALIEDAKARWKAQTMGQVPDEREFIPLPDR